MSPGQKCRERVTCGALEAASRHGSLSEEAARLNCRRPFTDTHALLFHAAHCGAASGGQPYDLTAARVFLADETRLNRDPFDTLICAAATELELPLITGR